MMRHLALMATSLFLSTSVLSAEPVVLTGKALLDKVLADATADSKLTPSFSRKALIYDDDGKLTRTTISQRENGKWTLQSVNGAAPPADILDRFNKNAAKNAVNYPRYADLKDFIGPNMKLVSETADKAIFTVAPLPPKSILYNDKDLSANLAGELVVIKGAVPYAAQLHITNPKPFKVSIATVEKFDTMMKFGLTASKAPVALENSTNVLAKVLFKSLITRNTVELSNYR
jgi:hypothetical protein